METTRRRLLTWTTTPLAVRRGYHVIVFTRLLREVRKTRAVGTTRSSLANPARGILGVYRRHPLIMVGGVVLRTVEDLQTLYGYVLEPAFRSGCRLVIEADRALAELAEDHLIDAGWGYAWTLERLRRLHAVYSEATEVFVDARRHRLPWASRHGDRVGRLDVEQSAAVRAGDGVVQVIAPAGSGKTTVLVARVKELVARGTSPGQILCTTFNRDAVTEMAARLAREGLAGVEVRSFHGLGGWILADAGRMRARLGGPTLAQWHLLARRAMAADPDGVWIDAATAQNVVSGFKLARMIGPEEALATAADAAQRTAAHLYELHERLLAHQAMLDFDDLIAHAVRLLQTDTAARRRWQARFTRVLVDEYQDIEPAQALLVGILAAPEDSLFCVGDEDQCIYAWRRATVQRVIELDQVYPGLERFPLVRNYRCGWEITGASRRLIEHNRQRFRKPLRAGATQSGDVSAWSCADRPAAAALAASWLREANRGDVCVLARTSTLLREVALACALRGVAFAAPLRATASRGARGTIEAYLRLLSAPVEARPEDVEVVCRVPNRSLPRGEAAAVADRLRKGAGFVAALAAVPGEPWRRARLAEAGQLFAALAAEGDAARLVHRLRDEGGLDRHYAALEKLAPTERVEVETLAHLTATARGCAVREFAQALLAQDALLAAHRRDDGIELTTIHGAKGREWDRVILFGADQGQLPHQQALDDGDLEDERRLCYVAFTRARERLDVLSTVGRPSRFIAEAGLVPVISPASLAR